MAVFIYGTLQDAALRIGLLGRDVESVPGILHGYSVVEQHGNPLPALITSAGQSAQGLLLNDLTSAEIARLDAYEMPFDYNPVRLDVDVSGANVSAQVYLPDAGVALSDRAWSQARWDEQSGVLTREMAFEIGSFDPPLSGAMLKAQWHMIALRAAVRLRARAEDHPAAIRFQPDPQDYEITRGPELSGDFFRLAAVDIRHRTFQDTTAGPLRREIFLGSDAALVLPYDAKTDRVLLVEQIRMGPLLRGDGNPWALEPIAGMIDAGESPAHAALRESEEEAGLRGITLEQMFSYYPSTGSSTDYFFCFAGFCDLPAPTTYTGGLATESEDLRLHVLPFDTAFGLIATGEANNAALVSMLLWLAQNRARLRRTAPVCAASLEFVADGF